MLNSKKSFIFPVIILGSLSYVPLSWSVASKITSFDQYKKECLQQVSKRGLTAPDGEKLCNCALSKFRTKYDVNQFKAILEKAKNDKKVQANLNAVGEACFDEILYES